MFGLKFVSNKQLQNLREEITSYQRTLEDIGWINLSQDVVSSNVFITEGFKKMLQTCKLYYYKNPLAGHWVNLTTRFVFGEGVSTPKAKDEKVQEIINNFWNDPDNQASLTSFSAQHLLNNKLQYEGNLFFALFDDDEGHTRIRIFNTEEIADIINDPDDRMRPRFYKVTLKDKKYNFLSDSYEFSNQKYIYYPDWNNFNIEDFNIPDIKLAKNVAIFHIKINCDINDKFGVPELYRGIDWIKAHKDMAGDLATLIRALSTLAWKKKVKGTPAQVNALKSALQAKIDFTNKGPAAGSTQIENEAIDTSPISTPTGGAVLGEKGLRQMLLMVCAASGIFEHYYGNPESGNLATATAMELPMVKKFVFYQTIWTGIYDAILQYQINKKIDVGLLPGKATYDEKTSRMVYETELDRTIDIDFPPILEKDLKVVAEALQIAKTNNLISEESAARMFLLAANLNNIDTEIEDLNFSKEPVNLEPGKKKEEPIKEKIETPSRDPAIRLVKKNNYLLQRMNGYRKALAGNFMDFKKSVQESIKTVGTQGKIVGIVDNLEETLKKLKKGMIKSAESYFPVAIDIGKKYLQAHLKESQIKESLFEARGKEKDLLSEKLAWNEKYLSESLVPDIEAAIMAKARMAYDTPEDFNKAINESINNFESRIEQYSGAFWHVEEAAVKDAGEGTGLMVNFVGADDSATCDGCAEAMNGNPYLIDEAPEPGSHQCDGRCRHALQIIE